MEQYVSLQTFAPGYEVMDLVRRSGSTKQKSDLMMTLAQAQPTSQEVASEGWILGDMVSQDVQNIGARSY